MHTPLLSIPNFCGHLLIICLLFIKLGLNGASSTKLQGFSYKFCVRSGSSRATTTCMALVFTSRPTLSSATEAIVCNTTSSKSNTENNINYYFSESRNDSKSCTALRMNCSYHTRRSACRLSNASGSSSNFCMVGITSFQDSTITTGEYNQ